LRRTLQGSENNWPNIARLLKTLTFNYYIQTMRFFLLILLFIFCTQSYSQDSVKVHKIDSLVKLYGQKMRLNETETIESNLLLEGNKTQSIRFHKKDSIVYSIIVQDNDKINVHLFFLDSNKLVYVANFSNGDMNEISSSVYIIDNIAYIKQHNKYKQSNPAYWFTLTDDYLSILKKLVNSDKN
jgi:hypothetical protein